MLLAALLAEVAGTRVPPPPIRFFSTVPPPPLPPPGLLASFNVSNEFQFVVLGDWAESTIINSAAGLLVAQAYNAAVRVYGVLSGLPPTVAVTSVLFTEPCPSSLATDAWTLATTTVGSSGVHTIELVQTQDASFPTDQTLTEASAQNLARSGYVGVYVGVSSESEGKLLLCGQLTRQAYTQIVLLGRMPACVVSPSE